MAGSWLLLVLNLPESSPLRGVTAIAGLPAVIALSIIHLRAVHRARQRMYHVVTDRFVRLLVPRWTFGPVPYSFRLEKLHGLRFVEDGTGGGTLWFGADTRVPGQRVAPWTGNSATVARLEDVADPRPAFEAIQRARSVGPREE